MEENLILTVVKSTYFKETKFRPVQIVGNWVVKDKKEANRIIKKVYEELKEFHKDEGELVMEKITPSGFAAVNKERVFMWIGDLLEAENSYEFYIEKAFDKKLSVMENFKKVLYLPK